MEPEHIDGNSEFSYFRLSGLAHRGVAAIAGDHQAGLNAQGCSVRFGHLNTRNARPIGNHSDGPVLHAEIKGGELPGLPDQKIEEIPLHKHNKLGAGRDTAEIRGAKRKITNAAPIDALTAGAAV